MYIGERLYHCSLIPIERLAPHILGVSIDEKPEHLELDDVRPELRQLLETKFSSDLNDYAPRANTTLAESITKEKEYKRLKRAYARVRNEKGSHNAFAAFFNYIFEKLREHRLGADQVRADDPEKIVLVTGDYNPPETDGLEPKMYPDLFGIRKGIQLKHGENGEIYDRATREGHDVHPFSLWDPLFFVEVVEPRNDQTKAAGKFSKKRKTADKNGSPNQRNLKKLRKEEHQATSSSTRPTSSSSEDECEDTSIVTGGKRLIEKGNFECGDYVWPMMIFGGLRTFILGLLISGGNLQLSTYQRSSVVPSRPLSFLLEDIKFIGILEGLERLTDRQFGRFNPLAPGKGRNETVNHRWERLCDAILELEDDEKRSKATKIKISRVFSYDKDHTDFVAMGQVIDSLPSHWEQPLPPVAPQNDNNSPEKPSGTVIVKTITTKINRSSEDVLIKEARETADRLPNRKWAKKRLPNLLFAKSCSESDEHEIRVAFATSTKTRSYDYKGLRLLVFTPLIPITEIKSPLELLRVYIDLIEAHKFLVQDCGTLHRDISLNNLMHQVIVEDGIERKFGVLNDLDCAIRIVDQKPSCTKIGTYPFMAWDLLEPEREVGLLHYPRHDLESFFYAMLHHTTSYDLNSETQELTQVPVPSWYFSDKSSAELHYIKSQMWFPLQKWYKEPAILTDRFKPVFDGPITRFYDLIQEGMKAYRKRVKPYAYSNGDSNASDLPVEPFNIKTWDGILTHNKVLAILKEELEKAVKEYEPEGPDDNTIEAVMNGHEADFGYDDNGWESPNEQDNEVWRALVANKRK